MKLLTFQETVNLLVRKHPIIFWGRTAKEMEWNVANHIFNTTGTGYSKIEGIRKLLDNEENRQVLEDKKRDLLFEGVNVYQIVDKENIHGEAFFSKSEEKQLGKFVFLINEQEKHLSEGFKKEYNFFYNMKKQGALKYFDITWFIALKDFYMEAKQLINDENFAYYHKPNSKSDYWLEVKNDFLEDLEKSKLNNMEDEFYSDLEKTNGFSFKGDVDMFFKTKWEKEAIRINEFIDEILLDIEYEIQNSYKKEKSL